MEAEDRATPTNYNGGRQESGEQRATTPFRSVTAVVRRSAVASATGASVTGTRSATVAECDNECVSQCGSECDRA